MSNISRSVYQKVVEENKRLKEDIRVLVNEPYSEEYAPIYIKWVMYFTKEEEFNKLMKDAAIKYVKEHENEMPEFLKSDDINN